MLFLWKVLTASSFLAVLAHTVPCKKKKKYPHWLLQKQVKIRKKKRNPAWYKPPALRRRLDNPMGFNISGGTQATNNIQFPQPCFFELTIGNAKRRYRVFLHRTFFLARKYEEIFTSKCVRTSKGHVTAATYDFLVWKALRKPWLHFTAVGFQPNPCKNAALPALHSEAGTNVLRKTSQGSCENAEVLSWPSFMAFAQSAWVEPLWRQLCNQTPMAINVNVN